MKKMLDKNTFLKILKEEWRKEVRNLFEREESDKKSSDDEKKKKSDDAPAKLDPKSMRTSLVKGLTIKNEKGLEFEIIKVTEDYVTCVDASTNDVISIRKTDEELGKYTLA